MRHLIVSLCLLSLVHFLSAQFYSTGQAPPSVKWQQINTEYYQLIFPLELEAGAMRVATILDYLYEKATDDYVCAPQKVSILLHNRSVFSNGFVTWAPKRSEWVVTPPQKTYPEDWLEQLAVHEFRHVLQMSNLDQGVTRILKLLFGEAAVGAVAGYLPLWFYEGDAVVSETALSSTGRGRESDFDLELRAIELDRTKRFSYDQSYLGSFKYFTPNHYKYGYQMVAYGELKYNNKIWNQAVQHTSRHPMLGAPFYFGLRKSGVPSKKALYNETLDSLKQLWNNTINDSNLMVTSSISIHEKRGYSDYMYVQASGGNYIAVRTSLEDIPRFILIKDSTEQILYTPGQYLNTRVDVGEKYICWEEYQLDERWQKQSFNQVFLLDISSGKKRKLGNRTRWFAPSLSPEEDRLVCLRINLRNEYSLIILKIPSGEIQQEIPLGNVKQAFSPVWIGEEELAYIALSEDGKSIRKIHLMTMEEEVLFQGGFINLDYLEPAGDRILFTWDKEIARNIYALDIERKEAVKLSSVRHGADFPSYDAGRNELLFSEYTLQGYRPKRVSLDGMTGTPEKEISSFEYPWAEALSKKTAINIQKDSLPLKEHMTKPYRRVGHGFNLHSWAPFYTDPYQLAERLPSIRPGIMLMSQNKLSTLTTLISYYYSDEAHYLEPRIIYEGFYPVFEVKAQISSKEGYYNWRDQTDRPDDPKGYKSIILATYLPLQLSRNKWRRYLRPEISFNYYHRYYYTPDGPELGYSFAEISLSAYNFLRQARRDLQPRFGQYVYFAFYQPLKQRDFFSTLLAGSLYQYVPGILPHHGLRLGGSYEQQEWEKYPILYNRIPLPRGYDNHFIYERNIKFSADYSLPLFCPDWSIGPLAYIKRFYLTGYFDLARVRYLEEYKETLRRVEHDLSSVGILLGAEMHFLRFFMPFHPLLRISYLPADQKMDLGFSISVDAGGL